MCKKVNINDFNLDHLHLKPYMTSTAQFGFVKVEIKFYIEDENDQS